MAPILSLALIVSAALTNSAIKKAREVDFEKAEAVARYIVSELRTGKAALAGPAIWSLNESWELDHEDLSVWLWGSRESSIILSFGNLEWDETRIAKSHQMVERDIAKISKDEKWTQPSSEILRVAIVKPARAEREMRRLLASFWVGYLLVAAIAFALYRRYVARFGQSGTAVQQRLDSFASGKTAARLDEAYPSPEFTQLSRVINPILGRLEGLMSDMLRTSENAAHELKRPIKKARLELSASDKAARPVDKAKVDSLLDEALSNVGAISELMRLDAERGIAPSLQIMDLSDLTEKRVESFEALFRQGDRTLAVAIEPDIFVRGEHHLLTLMLDNLFDNVSKYAPNDARISISLSRPNDKFRLSVVNSGAFPTDIRHRAFERYARSEAFWSVKGMGLGLSFVDRIAERHGFSAEIAPHEDVAEVVISGRVAQGSVK